MQGFLGLTVYKVNLVGSSEITWKFENSLQVQHGSPQFQDQK